MLSTTICVQVAGKVKEYASLIEQFGDFLAAQGVVISLHEAQRQARTFFKPTTSDSWRGLFFWVTLDDSGLAYHIEVSRSGSYSIKGAAPMPGPNNVQEIYVA